MSDSGAYLLRIVAAAIICGIATSLVGTKGSLASSLKLICGIFISITLISPLVNIKITDMTDYFDGIKADASDAPIRRSGRFLSLSIFSTLFIKYGLSSVEIDK